VRFSRLEEKCVARFDRIGAIGVTNLAGAGNYVVELPLRAVRMVRIRNFAGRQTHNFDVERMALVEI
jgi:hypothetical protein